MVTFDFQTSYMFNHVVPVDRLCVMMGCLKFDMDKSSETVFDLPFQNEFQCQSLKSLLRHKHSFVQRHLGLIFYILICFFFFIFFFHISIIHREKITDKLIFYILFCSVFFCTLALSNTKQSRENSLNYTESNRIY